MVVHVRDIEIKVVNLEVHRFYLAFSLPMFCYQFWFSSSNKVGEFWLLVLNKGLVIKILSSEMYSYTGLIIKVLNSQTLLGVSVWVNSQCHLVTCNRIKFIYCETVKKMSFHFLLLCQWRCSEIVDWINSRPYINYCCYTGSEKKN